MLIFIFAKRYTVDRNWNLSVISFIDLQTVILRHFKLTMILGLYFLKETCTDEILNANFNLVFKQSNASNNLFVIELQTKDDDHAHVISIGATATCCRFRSFQIS